MMGSGSVKFQYNIPSMNTGGYTCRIRRSASPPYTNTQGFESVRGSYHGHNRVPRGYFVGTILPTKLTSEAPTDFAIKSTAPITSNNPPKTVVELRQNFKKMISNTYFRLNTNEPKQTKFLTEKKRSVSVGAKVESNISPKNEEIKKEAADNTSNNKSKKSDPYTRDPSRNELKNIREIAFKKLNLCVNPNIDYTKL